MGAVENLKRPLLGAAVALCFASPAAYANPTGAAVVNGSASFARSGSTLTVTNTPGAIINWQQFSIGQNEVTRFIQQNAASAVLNRVVGVNPSVILGTLTSNGRVFLVNPSGITIGRGAVIDVAGFAASTLNLSDADFLSGRLLFQGIGTEGKLINAGTIRAADGGQVYLVAPNVENQKDAVITSPNGEVVIAAGRKVELVNSREPDIRVEYVAPAGEAVNAGSIVASSGVIGIYGTVVRNSGSVSASRAVVGDGGKIVFRASQDALLEAGSKVEAVGDKGGTVQVLGNRVGVLDGASIDVSGDAGGGTVLVGGDFQGRNAAVPNAWRTYFGAEATIHADALLGGDGGKVIVWADDITRAYGTISARGGALGGNGGFVEVSGKNLLDFDARVNVGAPLGLAGTLLLDPQDITISNTVTTNNADVADGSILFGDGLATSNWTISDEALEALTGNIVLQATRDITVNNNLSGGLNLVNQGSGERVVLQAGRDITIGSPITTAGAAIFLEADSVHSTSGGANGVGTLTINAAVTSNGGRITLIGGGNSILGGGGIALSENQTVNAGAGGIDVALSGNADLGVGSLGLLTQILGNPIDELHTTGALRIGVATTAGSNGLGAGAQNILADSVTNIYPGSAIDLTPQSGTSFEIYAGTGGIVLDQPLTTFQSTVINTTGTLTINDPINTTNNNLTLIAANVNTGANGSINTGTGLCSGAGCPVTTIFWDRGANTDNWFDANNWSTNAVPTASDDVSIGNGFAAVQIGASGAEARSVIANSGVLISGTGSLDLVQASQFADVFTLASGSLQGTGSASITGPNGALVWSGGSMAGAGIFQLVSGRSGSLTNSLVLNRAFQNEGLLTLSGATITGTGTFANAGTFTAAASTSNSISNLFQNISGTIAGTIQVNGALTLSSFSANDGTINVASGGSFSTANGSLTNLATGVIVADGAFNVGSGTFDNSGSAAFNGAATIGTLTLTAGTVDGTGDLTVGTNYNESGGALGTTFSDLSITKSGAFTVGGFTSVDTLKLIASGAVTLNGAVSTTTGGGDSIVISGTSFTNNAGASALNPGAGRFLVWSANPAGDDRGGQAYNFKQYNATFGSSTVLGSGNGFLYTVAPSVTPGLTGTVSKVYDATAAATLAGTNYSVSGAIDGDTVTLNNPVSGIYADDNVNSGINVSVSGLSIASATNGAATVYGYSLASSTASGNVGEITPAALTVTASDASKTYGQTVSFGGTEFTSSGLQGGETIGSVSLASAGAVAGANVPGSPYAITSSNATGGTFSTGNYTITYNNGSLTVSPAGLTVTADNKTREYGLANPTLAGVLSGFVNGDTASVVSGLTYDTSAVVGSNVGGYAITSSGGTATNYTITTRSDGTLTITQAPLTVTADNANREYGLANPVFTGTLTGFRNSETTSVVSGLTYGTTAAQGSNVGGYSITSSGGTATNYTITTRNDGTLTITQAPLTVTADNATREYGLANPVFTGALTGFRNSDTASVVSGLTYGTTAAQGSNVGGYAITSSGGTATNYTITTRNDGTLTITQAPLTVTADNANREYGLVNPSFTGTVTGFRNGDTSSVLGGLAYGTTAAIGSNVGGYAITSSGGVSTNYTITTRNDGTLTITQAPLTVTADNATREYGLTNVAFTGTLGGLRNSDTASVVSGLTYGSVADQLSNVGGYAITSSGGTATNYTITVRNDGTLSITPAPLTVAANDQSRTYGTPLSLNGTEFAANGLRNSDSIDTVNMLYTGGVASVAGGPYPIVPSGATGGSFSASNYSISYVNGQLTVSPATLTYLATAASRTTGEPNQVFDGQVNGFVNGESLGTATSGTALWQSPADASSLPGSYAIDGSGLIALNGNYTFVQALSNASALTVLGASPLPPAAVNPPPPAPPPTTSGPIVPDLGTGNLLNVNTGESVPMPQNSLPDPGIYLNQDGGSVMVVGQGNAATQLVFPTVNYAPGFYVNSETGFIYVINENTQLDPGVYYNRESQTVLVVSADNDGVVKVSSADVTKSVQTVSAGVGGRRVASIACR